MAKSMFLSLRLVLCLMCLLSVMRSGEASAKCEIGQVAELQVVMEYNQVLVPVTINGHAVQMLIDTGASNSILFRNNAQGLNLSMWDMPDGDHSIYGVGGEAHLRAANIAEFQFDSRYTAKNVRMLVVDERGTRKSKAVGLIGQDFLSNWDVEVDLAHGKIRLLKPFNCHGDEIVYWSPAYSKVRMEPDLSRSHHTVVQAYLNGKAIDAYLDTGADVSIVTLAAAGRAGVRPTSHNVSQAGASYGIGNYNVAIWTAAFDSFSVGGETIKPAKIEMGEMFKKATYETTGSFLPQHLEGLPNMLLGADFFLAHRVLISNQQQVVYFTYNGGPVFDTSQPPTPVFTAPASRAAAPDTQATKPTQVDGAGDKGG